MATYYVSSVDGSDADGGTSWALAKATLAAGLALCTATGDKLYVDSAHNETSGSSVTLNLASSINVEIFSVNRSNDTYLAGAKVTLTANATGFNIVTSGGQHLTIRGLTFETQNGNSSSNSITMLSVVSAISSLKCYNCTFNVMGTSTSAIIGIGGAGASTSIMPVGKFVDCTFNLRNAASVVIAPIRIGQGNIEIINPTIGFSGANKPTTCFGTNVTGCGFKILIEGDLSGYNVSGGTTFSVANFNGGTVVFRNCKYSSTPTFIGGTFASNSFECYVLNSDSGDTKTVFEYRNRLGTITAKTAKYADDGLTIKGTNVSWEVVTTSACNALELFCTPEIVRASTTTSSMTATMEFAQESSATALKNSEVWCEMDYVSSNSFPLGAMVSSQVAALATPADCTTSTIAWTGLSGTPTKQKIAHTFTPGEACDIRGRLCFGVASKTIYVDPTIRFS